MERMDLNSKPTQSYKRRENCLSVTNSDVQDQEKNPLFCCGLEASTQQSEVTYYSTVCVLFLGNTLKLLHSENPFLYSSTLCCSIMQVVGYGFKSSTRLILNTSNNNNNNNNNWVLE